MSAANSSNANASATQPRIERKSYGKLTEDEFLAHEAELAKTALHSALSELKQNLASAGDVRLWAHHYPWLTVGMAAATGFALAAVAKSGGPPPETDEDSERQRLLREMAKAPYNAAAPGAKPRVGESLMGSLFSLARTALEASLITAIRQQGAERPYGTQTPAGQVPNDTSAWTVPGS